MVARSDMPTISYKKWDDLKDDSDEEPPPKPPARPPEPPRSAEDDPYLAPHTAKLGSLDLGPNWESKGPLTPAQTAFVKLVQPGALLDRLRPAEQDAAARLDNDCGPKAARRALDEFRDAIGTVEGLDPLLPAQHSVS